MLICDKCGASITEGSKYCPQCGDPVTDADRVTPLATESQVANVEISFGYSSSPNYKRAVEICKNISSYSVSGEGKQVKHKITLPITEIELIVNLYEVVGSWKSSKMLINGQVATKKDLTYYGIGCYRIRQKAYQPEQYCFGETEFEANIWGCKRLNMPILPWGDSWLDYGEFDNSGVWHFDKKRIKHALELGLKENEFCPALNRKRVLETLEKLPNSINPKKDKNWEYKTSYEMINGEYKEVAIGIRPVLKKINRYVISDYKPTWEISEESDSTNDDEYVLNIKLQLDDEEPKKQEKNSSMSAIWWLIALILFLYIIL